MGMAGKAQDPYDDKVEKSIGDNGAIGRCVLDGSGGSGPEGASSAGGSNAGWMYSSVRAVMVITECVDSDQIVFSVTIGINGQDGRLPDRW